jgi:GTPase SAR1 family protein
MWSRLFLPFSNLIEPSVVDNMVPRFDREDNKTGLEITISGLPKVGKTTLIYQVTQGRYYERLPPTLKREIHRWPLLISKGWKRNWKSFLAEIWAKIRKREIDKALEAELEIIFYDLGGQYIFQEKTWPHWVQKAGANIYMIDGTQPQDYCKAADLLTQVLSKARSGTPLAILYNKKDLLEDPETPYVPAVLPDSSLNAEIFDIFRLEEYVTGKRGRKGKKRDPIGRQVQFFETSMKTGEGILDVLQWFAERVDYSQAVQHIAHTYRQTISKAIRKGFKSS